ASPPSQTNADNRGMITLEHCADLPLLVTLNAPGHEIVSQRFETVTSNAILRVATMRGHSVSGRVVDEATGSPVQGAVVRIVREQGPGGSSGYGLNDSIRVLAVTDVAG